MYMHDVRGVPNQKRASAPWIPRIWLLLTVSRVDVYSERMGKYALIAHADSWSAHQIDWGHSPIWQPLRESNNNISIAVFFACLPTFDVHLAARSSAQTHMFARVCACVCERDVCGVVLSLTKRSSTKCFCLFVCFFVVSLVPCDRRTSVLQTNKRPAHSNGTTQTERKKPPVLITPELKCWPILF